MHAGMGTFVAPSWYIPTPNPVRSAYGVAGLGDIVDGRYTLPSKPFGMGDIVDGIYNMPPNAVVADLNARIALAEALQKYPVGLSCGPSQCPCQVGLCGPGMGI